MRVCKCMYALHVHVELHLFGFRRFFLMWSCFITKIVYVTYVRGATVIPEHLAVFP